MFYHTPREYCNGIARMSAMKSVIVALYLIIGQMQVFTAISANTSKSLKVQFGGPNRTGVIPEQNQHIASLYNVG